MAGKIAKSSSRREKNRLRRKMSVKKTVRGTDNRPRLCVFRSTRYTYAQLISDESGRVLAAVSTRGLEGLEKSTSCVESAKVLGKTVASLASKIGVSSVVFDRNGYLYHGRVAAVADGAREGGLKF